MVPQHLYQVRGDYSLEIHLESRKLNINFCLLMALNKEKNE